MLENESKMWEKVLHTDARVTAIEGQIADLATGVGRIEAHLLNKPAPNYLAVALAVGALLFGISEYTDFRMRAEVDPLRQRVISIEEAEAEIRRLEQEFYYEKGRNHERWEQNEGNNDHRNHDDR